MKNSESTEIKSFLQRITFKRLVILIILALIALPVLKGVFFGSDDGYSSEEYKYKYLKGDELSNNKILAVGIKGLILTESSEVPNPLDILSSEGITYGYDVKETLVRAAKFDSIKGVLLQVNSPGGTIAGSKAIADGIEHYKKTTSRPVYAHIRDVGASGAYWAAIVSDKVFVDTGSLVGSIGVMMGPFIYYNNVVEEGSILGNTVTEGGIDHTIFSSGQYKDTGTPYRPLTDEERAHWQTSLDNEYDIFVNHVSKYRNISKETIVEDIKALPYENKRAKELGLIDEEGSEEATLTQLLADAGVKSDNYQLMYEMNRSSIVDQLFGVFTPRHDLNVSLIKNLSNTPLYLYNRNYIK